MNKYIKIIIAVPLLALGLTSCEQNDVIKVSASIVPHAKILKEIIAPILLEQGYKLKVRTLNWSIQNDSLLHNEYDANYFQHTLFLNTYEHADKLAVAAKVHYERLCMYASNKDGNKRLDNGESIVIVNDLSNIERSLKLLQANNILTINESNYIDDKFINFDILNPNKCITFKDAYKDCKITCISEANLCLSLDDYHFGIIPGNTALLGLGDKFHEKIVMSENLDLESVDQLSNVIAVRKENLNDPKTIALVNAFKDTRVENYIKDTFDEAVIYTFKSNI